MVQTQKQTHRDRHTLGHVLWETVMVKSAKAADPNTYETVPWCRRQ